jgi:hypothetical protein
VKSVKSVTILKICGIRRIRIVSIGLTRRSRRDGPLRAIYSRNTAIRFSSVPRFKSKTLFVKFHHGTKLWASQNIFASRFNFGFFPNMAIS